MFTGAKRDYDDSLTVLISDPHVGGTSYCQKYQADRLRKVVGEILAMDPLPRRVLCFGDLAWTAGWRLDYQFSKPILQPLMAKDLEALDTYTVTARSFPFRKESGASASAA